MSGGTWDYAQHRVTQLAKDIRNGTTRADIASNDDLPKARALVADLLDLTAALAGELDWHFAGDTHIDNEERWKGEALDQVWRLWITHMGPAQHPLTDNDPP